MQAYANVATPPERFTAKASGNVYWQFRCAESSKGDDKDPCWYTVRIFKDVDPQLQKGDFVVFTGKLKNDVYMARDGKPAANLTVMAFQVAKVAKDGKREERVNAPTVPKEAVAQQVTNPALVVANPAIQPSVLSFPELTL